MKKPLSYKTAAILSCLAACLIFFAGTYIRANAITRYSGLLPCADCTGIKTTLSLKGDHTYQLRSIYLNKGTPFTEKGVWKEITRHGKTYYQLTSGLFTSYYEILNNKELRMTDNNGDPLHTSVNTILIRE